MDNFSITNNKFQNEGLPILLCCRLYTTPLLMLKNLRHIWERAATDSDEKLLETDVDIGIEVDADDEHKRNKDTHDEIPFEFLTMRRRPRRARPAARANSLGARKHTSTELRVPTRIHVKTRSDEDDTESYGSFLADLKSVTDTLAPSNLDQTSGSMYTLCGGLAMEQSRDSGFGSFSNSIISESDVDSVVDGNDITVRSVGYFPVTMSAEQRKISGLVESWMRQSPMTFDELVTKKMLESFANMVTIHSSSASEWMAWLNTRLVNAKQFRKSIRRSKMKYAAHNRYLFTNHIVILALTNT